LLTTVGEECKFVLLFWSKTLLPRCILYSSFWISVRLISICTLDLKVYLSLSLQKHNFACKPILFWVCID